MPVEESLHGHSSTRSLCCALSRFTEHPSHAGRCSRCGLLKPALMYLRHKESTRNTVLCVPATTLSGQPGGFYTEGKAEGWT